MGQGMLLEIYSKVKKQLFSKKYRILIAIILAACGAVTGLISYFQVNNYKRDMEKEKSCIFMTASGEYDDEETAALILKNDINVDLVEKGKEILKKHGFNDEYKTFFDLKIKAYTKQMLIKNAVLYITMVMSILITVNILNKKSEENVDNINEQLLKIYGGNYDSELNDYDSSADGRLNNTLNVLKRKLKLNEKKLNHEKEEVKSIVTNISHQLKTPIAGVKMCYSLLEDDSLDEEEKEEFFSRMGDEINHLENLAISLLNISKMESGIININKKNAHIFDTVIDAVNAVYMKAEEKDINIEIDDRNISEIEKITLPHDKKWTREAVANVLENAVKYSSRGSKITIRLFKMVNFLRIEISDEGIGIPKEDYNNIFKRFYRGSSDMVQNAEGSGVGLYLTRRILEEQGGSISVSSRKSSEKSGSTFVIQLSLN